MRIGFVGDHAGYLLAPAIQKFLKSRDIEFVNFGTHSSDSVDYPDYAQRLSIAITAHEVDLGIASCGTGNGMAMCLNKNPQVRAGIAWEPEIARLIKAHNNANVIVLPQRFISETEAVDCVRVWLDTEFEGGRHQRRVEKINKCLW